MGVDFNGNIDLVNDLLVDENGYPVLIGYSKDPANGSAGYLSEGFAACRLTGIGESLDVQFGDHGRTFLNLDPNEQDGCTSATFTDDNDLIVGGFIGTEQQGSFSDLMIIKLQGGTWPTTLNEIAVRSIRVNPNPNSGVFNIQGMESGDMIRIYDQQATLVLESVFDGSSQISLEHLSSGSYIIEVIRTDHARITQKLVVTD